MFSDKDISKSIQGITTKINPNTEIKLSVVIVAFRSKGILEQCIESLKRQTYKDFEVVLVDNGENDISDSSFDGLDNYQYIKMKSNVGCSPGKNIGAYHGRGEIVCFIDDDGVADENFVIEHSKAYHDYPELIGLRGKVLPKDDQNIFNAFASHYDLGDEIVPAFIDTETNASFRKTNFLEAGGFSSAVLRGDSEGVTLSYQIHKLYKNKSRLIYYPSAIVYHDFAVDIKKLIKKNINQHRARVAVTKDTPEIFEYINSFSHPRSELHYPQNFSTRIKLGIVRRFLKIIPLFA